MKSPFDPADLDKLCAIVMAVNSHPLMARYRALRRALHGWLFGTGTRGIEALNAAALLGWGVALLDDRLLALQIYIGAGLWAHQWANEALAGLFLIGALFAIAGILRKDPASDKLASMGLQLGGLLWAGVAINFFAAYPPLNTGVGMYGLLAFFTWSAGCHLWND